MVPFPSSSPSQSTKSAEMWTMDVQYLSDERPLKCGEGLSHHALNAEKVARFTDVIQLHFTWKYQLIKPMNWFSEYFLDQMIKFTYKTEDT